MQWLQGHGSQQQIRTALQSVLTRIWNAGFQAAIAALAKLGIAITLALLLQGGVLKHLMSDWLDEITHTRMARLAAILAEGGTADELAARIAAVLGDLDSAELVAMTELNRADNAARMQAYRNAQVHRVRWVTTSVNPCPACILNRDAGPWPLGHPFPSGVIAPPDHPHCQCHLEPAED